MFGIAFGIPVGIVSGTVTGIALGLATGVVDYSPQAAGPRDVIQADGRYGLAIGPALGLAIGLTFGLPTGIAAGLVAGIAGGLAVGAWAWTRYHVAVVVIAARQRGPLQFAAFLDWAHQAGLLRVSGTAYQFRHRQLQDWLTSRQPPEDQQPSIPSPQSHAH